MSVLGDNSKRLIFLLQLKSEESKEKEDSAMDLTVSYNYGIRIGKLFSLAGWRLIEDVTPSIYSGSDQGRATRDLCLNLVRPLPQQWLRLQSLATASGRERTAAWRSAWWGLAFIQPAWGQQPTEQHSSAHTLWPSAWACSAPSLWPRSLSPFFGGKLCTKPKGITHTLPLQCYWNIVLMMCFSCPSTGHKGVHWPPGIACGERSLTRCNVYLRCLVVKILRWKYLASSVQVSLAPSQSKLAHVHPEWWTIG